MMKTIYYESLFSGSPDTIRLWDAVTGHPLTRMSTGRTEKHRETTVWSLIILDDFTEKLETGIRQSSRIY